MPAFPLPGMLISGGGGKRRGAEWWAPLPGKPAVAAARGAGRAEAEAEAEAAALLGAFSRSEGSAGVEPGREGCGRGAAAAWVASRAMWIYLRLRRSGGGGGGRRARCLASGPARGGGGAAAAAPPAESSSGRAGKFGSDGGGAPFSLGWLPTTREGEAAVASSETQRLPLRRAPRFGEPRVCGSGEASQPASPFGLLGQSPAWRPGYPGGPSRVNGSLSGRKPWTRGWGSEAPRRGRSSGEVSGKVLPGCILYFYSWGCPSCRVSDAHNATQHKRDTHTPCVSSSDARVM